MIQVNRVITADDTDALAGTDLDNIPEPGILEIYVASTQNDTEVTVTSPAQPAAARLIRAVLRSNGMPLLSDDTPYSVPVAQGHVFLNVNIVTAATVGIYARFIPLDELP